MSWTHSSKLAAGLLALALVVAAGAFGAAAIEFEGDTPDSAEVGTEVHIEELTLTEPFEVDDPWEMEVTTELDDARLVVETRDGAGNVIDEEEVTDGTVVMELDSQDGVSDVVFEVRGDVPSIGGTGPGQYSYEDRSPENITALQIVERFDGQSRVIDNGTFEIHRYTQDSQEARQAIDEANEAAEDADSDDARDRVDEAITFYNSGEFGNAIDAANDAKDIADSEGETRRTLMIIGGVLAVLIAIGGIAYFWRSRQEPANKLQ